MSNRFAPHTDFKHKNASTSTEEKLLETNNPTIREIERTWFEYKFVIADAVPALEKQVNEIAREGYQCKSITVTSAGKWIATMEIERIQYKAPRKEEHIEQTA